MMPGMEGRAISKLASVVQCAKLIRIARFAG